MPQQRPCRSCESTDFFVHESYLWRAEVGEDGVLSAWYPDSAIDAITCAHCEAEYSAEDFANIEFS